MTFDYKSLAKFSFMLGFEKMGGKGDHSNYENNATHQSVTLQNNFIPEGTGKAFLSVLSLSLFLELCDKTKTKRAEYFSNLTKNAENEIKEYITYCEKNVEKAFVDINSIIPTQTNRFNRGKYETKEQALEFVNNFLLQMRKSTFKGEKTENQLEAWQLKGIEEGWYEEPKN